MVSKGWGGTNTGSRSAGISEEVDVEALAEAETVLLAGIDQPIPAGSEGFQCDSFWHEKSLPRRDGSIKRKQQLPYLRKLCLVGHHEFELERV
jgi:hypothetical protein